MEIKKIQIMFDYKFKSIKNGMNMNKIWDLNNESVPNFYIERAFNISLHNKFNFFCQTHWVWNELMKFWRDHLHAQYKISKKVNK